MATGTPDPKWILVQFEGDDRPSTGGSDAPESEELGQPGPALPEPDTHGFHVLITPPLDADPEILSIDQELAGAEELVRTTVKVGYWIHGPRYFDAVRSAINAPLANEYQGSQQPLRQLSPDQRSKLMDVANNAITERQQAIGASLIRVQAEAATYARARLEKSQEQLMTTTMRYISEADTRRRALGWLQSSELAGGAHTFEFVEEDGIDLVRGLWTIWTAYRAVAEREAKLARAMKESGREMQQIAANRWLYLRNRDRANTPAASSYASRDYGVQLQRATSPRRPDLVAEAESRFPEPERVVTARNSVYEAAGVLATTLVDEGAKHPLLYRIWSPSLAETLHDRFDGPGSLASMKFFSPVFEFRRAVSDTLRSSWSAATSLSDKIEANAAHVWRFPLLISTALDGMLLEGDAFTRVAAEHRLDELAEDDARLQRFFAHASAVLTSAGLAVRLVPVPAVSMPASVAIAAVDIAVSGLGLLAAYFKEADTREGFRAFLAPGDSFAASDGSYFGTIVGAAFLLFGLAGLRRTSFTPPTRVEVGLTGAAVGGLEYQVLTSTEPRP